MPVVPPVYSSRRWSPDRPHGPATRSVVPDSAADSYGVAHSGQAPRPVVDPEPRGHPGDPGADGGALIGEAAVEHDGGDVGVVPEVDQFIGGVPVVRVDHGHAGLERCEHRLEILRRVVQVLGDLVLLGGSVGGEQGGGDTVRTPVEVGPRVSARALLLRQLVGDLGRDGFPQVGQVPSGVAHRASR